MRQWIRRRVAGQGFTDGLVRLSIGIEALEDLRADLAEGLERSAPCGCRAAIEGRGGVTVARDALRVATLGRPTSRTPLSAPQAISARAVSRLGDAGAQRACPIFVRVA